MRLGDTEVIVATVKILSGISRYWQRDPDIRVKNPKLAALAHAAPSIIIRDVG